MKIIEKTNERLIIEEGDPAFDRILLATFAMCACVALGMLYVLPGAWRAESFQGVVFGAALALIGFLVVFERATFTFDRAVRTLTWHRRRAFASRSGVLPFQHIREVKLQPAIGDAINPKVRIVLVLANGELAVSTAYAPDASGSALALAKAIREMTGEM